MAAYCVLTYPTLEHWLTTAHLDSNSDSEQASAQSAILRAAESTSTHLTIVVRTAGAALPNPWDPASPSSSSSSSGGGGGEPTRTASPTRFFLRLERALARVYSIATDSFAQRDLVLAQVDVVLEQLRRQPVCIPSSSATTTVIRWQATDEVESANQNGTGNGSKGKDKETTPVPADHTPSGADHHYDHHDPHMKTLYPVVALGGTFDHLHSGHKILLTMAASITSRKLIVGVTDDALLKTKKFRDWLEPLPFRIRNVENFIALIRPEIECACVPLQDVYGPTATDPEIEALVVSDETRAGGQAINTLRASRSLSILRIFCIALVAESTPSRVPSSTNLPAEALTTKKDDDDEEEEEVEGKVVVSPATKMGSTGIREWLSKRRQEEQQRTGA
ncbi:hypothetical protein JCM8115_005731 [Rhodotorula mucilaginosa]|uniref:Cytidyltransferase-like domain-containing protein n=1 Tax=Rhodotorula mucilaginosa TaxID=5537 RepID=A0A9P7B747_RHOMI|nr:hypothetical protein C6P46_002466 [Rhodotorula mucilaginosa]